MDWFDAALMGTGGVYLAAVLWLVRGLGRSAPTTEAMPAVSVIVAARDEEATLGACLKALRGQDYAGPLEVVVVDDGSEDRTAALVEEQRRQWAALRLVRASAERPFRCPKKSALAQGIAASQGELLLFTDADCYPPPGWVRSMAGCFAEGVGLVAGYAYPEGGKTFFQKLLALDNLAVGALGAGSFAMGRPLSCTGRNLAYGRTVYEEVGGFAQIGHLIGGDDVYFMRRVAHCAKWKMVFNREEEAAVPGAPPPERWGRIAQQKLRHASKAGHYGGGALALSAMVYLFHLGLAAGMVRLAATGTLDGVFLGVWGARCLVDGILLGRMALPQERHLLRYLPLLELCYIPYILFFTPLGRLGWFRWKERGRQEE